MGLTDFIPMPFDETFCAHCQGRVEVVLLFCDRSGVAENAEQRLGRARVCGDLG